MSEMEDAMDLRGMMSFAAPPADVLGLQPATVQLLGRVAAALEDIAATHNRQLRCLQKIEAHIAAARKAGEAGSLDDGTG